MTEIELLKQEIKMLQSKLSFLEELEKTKSPVEEAYKDVYGHYPETSIAMGDWDAVSWDAFQKGYEAAQLKDGCPEPPDEPEYYDEVEWDEKDNPPNLQKIVDKMIKEHQAQKLYNRLYDELGYDFEDIKNVVSLVEDWLPEPQSAAGSQNVNTELLVDGFNHCLQKMKEMLR